VVAVAVGDQDQVDLAELGEVLEVAGVLGFPVTKGSITITLPPAW